jgi:aspartyl/asparaginyl-tRNA synthetase
MPTFAGHLSWNQFISAARKFHLRWVLSFFVGLLCTNMANPTKTLAADAPLTPIASITKALTNHEVTVQAVISNVREPSSTRAPYLVSLTEGGATLPLVYWSDMQPQLASKVKVGNLIQVNAKVSVYRDQLQLLLHDTTTLNVVKEAAGAATPVTAAATNTQAVASPTASPTVTVIGAIKADWADRVVTISGTIAASDSIDKTQRLSVQDATGEIQVVFGEKALSGLPVAQLQPGRVITVTGPVKLENGTRTIVPDAASAVKFAPQ